MIEYLIFAAAIPLGIVLASLTTHEINIYKKKQYFPLILITLAITSALTLTSNKQASASLIFMFLTTLTWSKAKP